MHVARGTPYFNFFKGGAELELPYLLRFDTMTMGNHEFDSGLGALRKTLGHHGGRIVATNVAFSPDIATCYALIAWIRAKGTPMPEVGRIRR